MLDIKAAAEELKKSSFKDIHKATAWKWASRAAACYETVLLSDPKDFMRFMLMASDFIGEAREHSAEVSSHLLDEINDAVNPHMQKAWKHVESKKGES